MRRLAEGLELLDAPPVVGFNVYLVDDVLLDSGGRQSPGRILRQVRGRHVQALALTHVNPDHAGGSRAICQSLQVPLWCGAADARAMEAGSPNYARDGLVHRLMARAWNGPGHAVSRRLREGDRVGSFTVLETPGVTPGHVSLWREWDRTLIAGEVLNDFYGLIPFLRPRPHAPVRFATADPRRNRESARRLAALEPALVCFCHGPPSRDTRMFVARAASLGT